MSASLLADHDQVAASLGILWRPLQLAVIRSMVSAELATTAIRLQDATSEVLMERIKCEIREADGRPRDVLVLLAEETLHPLAERAGHPERYHAGDVAALLDRADVFVAQCGGQPAGSWRWRPKETPVRSAASA